MIRDNICGLAVWTDLPARRTAHGPRVGEPLRRDAQRNALDDQQVVRLDRVVVAGDVEPDHIPHQRRGEVHQACAAGSSFVEMVRCRWFSRSVTVTSPPSTGSGIGGLLVLVGGEERVLGDDVGLVVADLHARVDVDRTPSDARRRQNVKSSPGSGPFCVS